MIHLQMRLPRLLINVALGAEGGAWLSVAGQCVRGNGLLVPNVVDAIVFVVEVCVARKLIVVMARSPVHCCSYLR